MRRPALTGVAAVTLLLLAVCGGDIADAGTGTPAVADAEGAVSYPLHLTSPFGSAELQAASERIVALTSADLAALLAVGVVPHAAALYDGDPDDPQPEWIDDAFAGLGSEPEVYFDMSSGDVLDVANRGAEAVAEREHHLAALAADHPETLDQYLIPGENPTKLIETLGFLLSAGSRAATYENSAISLENLSQLEADIVLISYPWADETAVQQGRYVVPDGDVPSNLPYPDAMSLEWTLDQLVLSFEEAFPA